MFLRKTPKLCEIFKGSLFNSHLNLMKFTNALNPTFHTLDKQSSNYFSLTHTQTQSFGFKFIGIPKRKGMRLHKHRTKKNSPKKRGLIKVKYLHKVSNHNGLLKRVKIVKNIPYNHFYSKKKIQGGSEMG